MFLRSFALALTLVAGPALAQHAGHPMPAPAAAPAPAASAAVPTEAPSSAALRAANMKMHKDMDVAFSGDPDVDFVRAMIPHHQGAVEMARVELQYGKDKRIRKLARDIVKAQEKEIALMQAFLKKKGVAQ